MKQNGHTLEHSTFWDPQSDVWIERDPAALWDLGVLGGDKEGVRAKAAKGDGT